MRDHLIKNSFIGGIAEGSRSGYQNSYADGVGVDYRTDRDQVTTLKALKKDSGTTVTDLIMWYLEYSGAYFGHGNAGKVYKRASDGTWTNPKTVSSSHGNGLEIFNDELWYAGDASLGKATGISGTATFYDDYLKSLTSEKISVANYGAAQVYTLLASISEAAANKIDVALTGDNIYGFYVLVVTKGTGTLVLTLHNAANTVIATKTIANADIVAGLMRVEFDAKTTIDDATYDYHLHITSSVADTTVRTATASDLSTLEHVGFAYFNDLDTDQSNDLRSTVSWATSYTMLTAISEAAVDRQTFVPEKQMLAAISVYMRTRGAGDITVTLHDENNKSLGSKTLTNANVLGKGIQRFDFSSNIELTIGASYHFHVTSTAGSATMVSDTGSDHEGIGFLTHYPVLVSDTSFHAMKEFGNLLCIGNGRYLATMDDSEIYDPETLTLPKGEKVRCLAIIGDHLAIGVWKGTAIDQYGESKIYLWDGSSAFWNAEVPVDGQVNAIHHDGKNRLMIISGTEGLINVYTGGIDTLRKLKGVGANKTVEIYPQAIGVWEGLVRFGISDGTSTAIDRVIYTYGKKDKDFPASLSKDYPISTGNFGSTVQIGMVLGVSADEFFVSWKDSATYGVDIINTAADQATGTIETLKFDANQPTFEKEGITFTVSCLPIVSGQSIVVKYRLNHSTSSWVTLGTIDTASRILQSFPIEVRFKEIEFAIDLNKGTEATGPTLVAYRFDFDIVDNEQLDNITNA